MVSKYAGVTSLRLLFRKSLAPIRDPATPIVAFTPVPRMSPRMAMLAELTPGSFPARTNRLLLKARVCCGV